MNAQPFYDSDLQKLRNLIVIMNNLLFLLVRTIEKLLRQSTEFINTTT